MHRTWGTRLSLVIGAVLACGCGPALADDADAGKATQFSEAFKKATDSPWKNPVMTADSDPRKDPDVKGFLQSGQGDLAVYASEYFPGWMAYTPKPQMTLFHRMPQVWRVGGPTRLAFSTGGKTEVFPAGKPIPADKLKAMDKPWMLVWFAGARNWDKFDMPVLVVLQHKPVSAEFGENLGLKFEKEAGTVVMLNLFGYYKPPQDNPDSRQFADAQGPAKDGPFGLKLGALAPTNVRPYEWTASLPEGIVQRCDFFAGIARAVPVFLRDSFQVDLAKNTLRIKYQVSYYQTADDWGTKAKKFAPISPSFFLINMSGGPAKFDGKAFDPVYPTTMGPWAGIPDVDQYQVDLGLLQYLTETYVPELNKDSADPLVKFAINRLTNEATKFCLDGKPFGPEKGYAQKDQKAQNFCWNTITADRTKAIAMAFLPEDKLDQARANMRNLYAYSYFTDSGYQKQQIPAKDGKTFYFRTDAGIGSDCFGDAGKLVMDAFQPAWQYAYYGRDYGWIADRVEPMEKMASELAQLAWARGGRANIAEMGDEGAPAMGFARLMYAARDQQRFAWGSYMATMELVGMYLKCGPFGTYARQFQPWHRLEKMDDTENPTDCNGGAFGWDVGGPGHDPIAPGLKGGIDVMPYQRHGSAQWVSRWRCMSDFDVDRFFTEQCAKLPGGLAFEFDTWLKRDFSDLGEKFSDMSATGRRRDGNGVTAFENPARVLTFCKQMLGESVAQVRARMNGWDMPAKYLEAGTWNWEPNPWIIWAMADRKQYERIMKDETLPWTPGLRSVYDSQTNNLVYGTSHLGRQDEVSGEPWLPFPQVGRWNQPARPKGSTWGLGFITIDPTHKVASVTAQGDNAIVKWSDKPVDPDPLEVALEGKGWKFALDPKAVGIREGWFKPEFDDSAWGKIEVPGLWEDQGYSTVNGKEMPKGVFPPELKANNPPTYGWPYDGVAWCRIKITVPEEFRGKAVYFHAGTIDDFDIVWVNGVQVGKTDASTTKTWWEDTRMYPVPPEALKFGGQNVITVLVGDNNAGGGINTGPVRLLAKQPAEAK